MVGLGLPAGAAGDSFRRDKAACWLVYATASGRSYPAVPSKRQQGTCFVKVAPPGMSQPPSRTPSVYCATL